MGYRELAISVLNLGIKDVSDSAYREDVKRFSRSRTCADMCELAGIKRKDYENVIRKIREK